MTKVSIVIQSHLSDALYETVLNPVLASQRIRFVKKLVNTFRNLDQEIDPEKEWNNFYRS